MKISYDSSGESIKNSAIEIIGCVAELYTLKVISMLQNI